MRFESLVRIINARLVGTPSISSYNGIYFDSKKVKQGGLYVAKKDDIDGITHAIKQGAHGILFDKYTQLNFVDNEIAWIQVSSLIDALIRLLRFKIEEKKLKVIYVNSLQKKFLSFIKTKNPFVFLSEELDISLDIIEKTQDGEYVYFSSKKILEKVAPFYENIPLETDEILQKPFEAGIFCSNFIFEGILYRNWNIPDVFREEWSALLFWLKEKLIDFELNPHGICLHFSPIFVDNRLCIKPFGSTSQAIIVESDPYLFEKEFLYLNQKCAIEPNLCFAPHNENINIPSKRYSSLMFLENLQYISFRYIMILGKKSAIEEKLQTFIDKETTLF